MFHTRFSLFFLLIFCYLDTNYVNFVFAASPNVKVTCFFSVFYAAGSQRTQRHRLRLCAPNFFDFPCVFVACGACRLLPPFTNTVSCVHTPEQMFVVCVAFWRQGMEALLSGKSFRSELLNVWRAGRFRLIFGVSLKVGNTF